MRAQTEPVSKEQYLQALRQQFPTVDDAAQEIINLNAVLDLPKETEQYVSDIHGEFESFSHVLRNRSGFVMNVIKSVFPFHSLTEKERKRLATLIYYPQRKLPLCLAEFSDERKKHEWLQATIYRLVLVCRRIAANYTRSRVRKCFPRQFNYIFDELLYERESQKAKQQYYTRIIASIIGVGEAHSFVVELCYLIQRLAVGKLHVIGDIFDRGPSAELVMDCICNFHAVDIQWGNHDILWIGAAVGSLACIATVLRISLRYGNLPTLEEGYGISMFALAEFARRTYGDDPCDAFLASNMPPRGSFAPGDPALEKYLLIARMQKAMAVIQFKLEGQLVRRRPSFRMEDRDLLSRVSFGAEARPLTVEIDGTAYELRDSNFPTVDPTRPLEMSDGERAVMASLKAAFLSSERLKRHVRFLFSHGSLYKVANRFLLIHGCVPLNRDGSFKVLDFLPEETLVRWAQLGISVRRKVSKRRIADLTPREAFDIIDAICRDGFFSSRETGLILSPEQLEFLTSPAAAKSTGAAPLCDEDALFVPNDAARNRTLTVALRAALAGEPVSAHGQRLLEAAHWRLLGQDVMWYLWCGPQSPIFCRDSKNTFERCFVDEPRAHVEAKNPFVRFSDDPGVVQEILRAFGCEGGRMINGFPEVDPARGEQPVRAGGRLINIDGGFSRFSHDKPDARGFTLISGSRALILVTHRPYAGCATRRAAELIRGIESQTLQTFATPQTVTSTDLGAQIRTRMELLRELLAAYIDGSYGGASEFPF
eukprot:gnl/Chilomastix_cuspidata/1340.p1 GENE.gnl/Chilomastix_cuspidata/1340~~gnl/Chilomastix_cuspidata/1340.p1  ORF type:complete len:780 (-),score=359.61 gnl/Chilomastix_cuspidata/1340:224-2521(-)